MLLSISRPPYMYLAIERPIITDGMKTDQGPRDFVQVSLQETFLSNCANQERLSAMQNPTTIHIVLLPIAALRYVYLAMITVEIIADGMKNDRGPRDFVQVSLQQRV